MKNKYCKLISIILVFALIVSLVSIGYVYKYEVKAASSNKTTKNIKVKYSWQKDTSPFKFDLYFLVHGVRFIVGMER